MPLGHAGHILLTCISDPDGNCVDVLFDGVNHRLAVDAIIGPGGPFTTDTDDDAVAAGQTLLAVLNLNYGFDGTEWRRKQVRALSASVDEALMGDLVRASLTGIDSSAAVGSRSVPIESRIATLATTFAPALAQGLIVNSRTAGFNEVVTNQWQKIGAYGGDTDTIGLTDAFGLLVNSRTGAVDLGSGAQRQVQGDRQNTIFARGFTNGGVAGSQYGMWINATGVGADNTGLATGGSSGQMRVVEMILQTTSTGVLGANSMPAFAVAQTRESAFAASSHRRRFYGTNPAPATAILAQTVFASTTPTFFFRNTTSVPYILRSIMLVQADPLGSTPIRVVMAIDSADRFVAGGTAATRSNVNSVLTAPASAITALLVNATVTAAGGTNRYIINWTVPAQVGAVTSFKFKDGIVMSTPTSSFLIYTFATPTAPSWDFVFEWEEVV